MKEVFSKYELRTQVLPVVMVVAAPVVALSLELGDPSWASGAIGILVSLAIAVALAEKVAELGRVVQDELVTKWGGLPTDFLLTDDTWVKSQKLHALRHSLKHLFSEAYLESSNADFWNNKDWAVLLRKKGREDEAITSANVGYGWRRNSLGVKKIGIAMNIFTLVLSVVILVARSTGIGLPGDSFPPIVGVFLGGVFTYYWVFAVTEQAVLEAGRRYAVLLAELGAQDRRSD